MSGKCTCPASNMFPHRKSKCTFRKAVPAVKSIATAAAAVIPREPRPPSPPAQRPQQQQPQELPVAVASISSCKADGGASLPTGVFEQTAVGQEDGEVDNSWLGLDRCADSPPSVAGDEDAGADDLTWALAESLAGNVHVGGEAGGGESSSNNNSSSSSSSSDDNNSSSSSSSRASDGQGITGAATGAMSGVMFNTATALAAAASASATATATATATAPDTDTDIPTPAPAPAPEQAALPVPESVPLPTATQLSPSTASRGAVVAEPLTQASAEAAADGPRPPTGIVEAESTFTYFLRLQTQYSSWRGRQQQTTAELRTLGDAIREKLRSLRDSNNGTASEIAASTLQVVHESDVEAVLSARSQRWLGGSSSSSNAPTGCDTDPPSARIAALEKAWAAACDDNARDHNSLCLFSETVLTALLHMGERAAASGLRKMLGRLVELVKELRERPPVELQG